MVKNIVKYIQAARPALEDTKLWMETNGFNTADYRDCMLIRTGSSKLGFADEERAKDDLLFKLIAKEHCVHSLKSTMRINDTSMTPYSYTNKRINLGSLTQEQAGQTQPMYNQDGICRYMPKEGTIDVNGEQILLGRQNSGKFVCDKIDGLVNNQIIGANGYVMPQKYGDREVLPVTNDIVQIPDYVADSISLISKMYEDLVWYSTAAEQRQYNNIFVMPNYWLYEIVVNMEGQD